MHGVPVPDIESPIWFHPLPEGIQIQIPNIQRRADCEAGVSPL